MKRKLKLLFQLLTIIIMAGCLTPLDRAADYIGGQIVVSGQISPLEESSVLHIGRTASEERLPEPISGASVTVMDELGNEGYFSEDATFKGKYNLSHFPGVPGRAYHIRIVLPDGRTYESTPERMPPVTGEDSVYHAIVREEYVDAGGVVAERYFVNIYTSHKVGSSEEPIFIKWHVQEVYVLSPTDFPDPFNSIPPPCFISQEVNPQQVVLFSNEVAKATFIPDLQIASRILDRSFKERHYFITYQSSLTRDAYEYWRKVNIVANQSGSIFDAPPARVKGNIFRVAGEAEEVHGYFQAVNQTFHRFYLLPRDLPFGMPVHCEYESSRTDYPPECLDCLSLRNSSLVRPPWF